MSEYQLWDYLHILMFVFWVGTDMGVFLSALKSTDARLPIDARFLLLHMALRIELLPRTMWKAALPFGVMLSMQVGALQIGPVALAAIWIFSIAWWAVSMAGAWYYDKPVGHRLAGITNWVTGLVGVTLILLAASSATGNGPFAAEATWLHWKVALYGVINLLVVLMIKVFDPLGIAFGRLAVEGSKPEIEATVSSVMARSAAVIWLTYATIFFVAFIGITKIL